jgi:hypothetical protein
MGYQEREQREFQGLFTTRQGAGAPTWSASQITNIDFSYHSMRGRGSMERAIEPLAGHVGVRYTGYNISQSEGASGIAAMSNWGSSNRGGWLRLYVTQLDKLYYCAHAVGTQWFLAGVTGDSTDYGTGTGAGQTGGWALYLKHHAQDQLEFRLYATRKVTVPLIYEEVAVTGVENLDPDDVACVEFEYLDATSTVTLQYFVNGSETPTASGVATWTANSTGVASGDCKLAFGAFAPANDYKAARDHFVGVLGEFVFLVQRPTDTYQLGTDWMRWEALPATGGPAIRNQILPQITQVNGTSASVYMAIAHSGYGNLSYNIGTLDIMESVIHYPAPVTVAGNEMHVGAGQRAALYGGNALQVQETAASGVVFTATVEGPGSGTLGSAGAGLIYAGDVSGNNVNYFVNTIPVSPTTYRLNVVLYGVGDQTIGANRYTSTTLNSGPLNYGTAYRVAFFVQTDFSISIYPTICHLWVEEDATAWTISTPTANTALSGKPTIPGDVVFGPLLEASSVYVKYKDYRIHGNLPNLPTLAELQALDTYPPVATLEWPASTLASFDFSDAGTINTRTESYGEKLLQVDDNKTGTLHINPVQDYERNSYAVVPYMSGGMQSPTFGVHAETNTYGSYIDLDFLMFKSGGAWQYDVQNGTQCGVAGGDHYGVPMHRLHAVSAKDRTYVYGDGATPYKIVRCKAHTIGSDAPLIRATATSSLTNEGSLASNTVYQYRFALYNSMTGEESQLTAPQLAEERETGATDDTVTGTITTVRSGANRDWDMISVYRRGQLDGLYYLEQQIPYPYLNPEITSATITFKSTMSENELLLRPIEEVDNGAPPAFTAGTISGRCLVVGGAGRHEGWVYYSKPNRYESFPALNVWQLNDNDSDRVMGIYALFGRMIILKQRSMYIARDDAALTGEEPKLVHEGRGCVSSAGAAVGDNRLYFVAPDRCVYATDGMELQDISSPSIRRTMDELTDYQLQRVQLAHYAKRKQIWMSVPVDPSQRSKLASGGNGDLHYWHQQCHHVYVFSYDMGRWSRYEFAHSSISEGASFDRTAGEELYIATPARLYTLGDTINGYDGLRPGIILPTAVRQYSFLSGDMLSTGTAGQSNLNAYQVQGRFLVSSGAPLSSYDSYNGVPTYTGTYVDCSITPGSSDCFNGTGPFDNKDAPWMNATGEYTQMIPNEVALRTAYVTGGQLREEVWYRSPIFPYFAGAIIATTVWDWEHMQIREYRSQLWTPQGEGFDYVFSGLGYVIDKDIAAADFDATMWMYIDGRAVEVNKYDYHGDQWPDVSHSFRGRGRRYQFVLKSIASEFEITRVIVRFRTRGPRRVR